MKARTERRTVAKRVKKRGEASRLRDAAGRREKVLEWVPALVHLKNVLVAIDFSESSIQALRFARSFAEQFGARLTLIHVVEPVVLPDFVFSRLVMEPDKMVRYAEKKLEALCHQEGLKPKVLASTVVRAGKPFEEIAEAARGLKVDLIILATRGHTGLKHAWLGSTAERVIRHAPCPVLTVREPGG